MLFSMGNGSREGGEETLSCEGVRTKEFLYLSIKITSTDFISARHLSMAWRQTEVGGERGQSVGRGEYIEEVGFHDGVYSSQSANTYNFVQGCDNSLYFTSERVGRLRAHFFIHMFDMILVIWVCGLNCKLPVSADLPILIPWWGLGRHSTNRQVRERPKMSKNKSPVALNSRKGN